MRVAIAGMAGILVAGVLLAETASIERLRGWLEPVSAVGGPFRLQDQSGRIFTEKDLAGRPFALFFGFTHCPEVCPATLERMGRLIAGLGAAAERMRFVFATVDPARDTPAALKDYLAHFDPRIIGLTGNEAQVGRLLKAYRVTVRRGEDGIDHATGVYLMDKASHFVSLIGYDEMDDEALSKLRALLAHDAGQ
jgi:protein SCO1/2